MEATPIDELCATAGPRLIASLTAYVGDRAVAEELAQEALVRAWEHWDDVSTYASPEAWLFRTARNLATSTLRRRVIERRANRLRAVSEGDHPQSTIAESVDLREAIKRLPEKQRAAISCRYLLGLSVAETAVALDCSEGTIKSNTSDALTNLREFVGPFGGDEAAKTNDHSFQDVTAYETATTTRLTISADEAPTDERTDDVH